VNSLRFRAFILSITSGVNSQTKTLKVRDARLGAGDHFFAAKKYEGRIVNVLVYNKLEQIFLVGMYRYVRYVQYIQYADLCSNTFPQ
jgi:hypothetical protein